MQRYVLVRRVHESNVRQQLDELVQDIMQSPDPAH